MWNVCRHESEPRMSCTWGDDKTVAWLYVTPPRRQRLAGGA